MNKTVKVKVPATTANLGPGFDIIGVALNLYNYFELIQAEQYKMVISGTQNDNTLSVQKDNLIFKSIQRVFQELGIDIPELEIKVEINIPLSRGLGSSSSAIAGGLFAANNFCGSKIDPKSLLNLANEIEGHPDNVAPCLLGGIVTSLCEDKNVFTNKIDTKLDLSFITVIPDFKLSTEKARKALPAKIPFSDAVFNSSRLAFLLNGFYENNPDFLKLAFHDRLHEQYRGHLIKGFEEVKETALEKGATGSVLSGAGPTILAVSLKNEEEIGKAMVETWSEFGIKAFYKILKIDNEGTRVINDE